MFKNLLSIRLKTLGMQFTGNKNSSVSKKKLLLYCFLFIYVGAAFLFMFGSYFSAIAGPYHEGGFDWLYFTFVFISAFSLMFIGSVFTAKFQLFDAKDNELLLSMPIKPHQILLSRLTILLLLNFIFEAVVAVPAMLVYFQDYSLGIKGILFLIILLLLLPLLAVAVSAFFGWVISLLTSGTRRKSLLTVIFSVAFLGLYFFIISKAQSYISALAVNGEAIAKKLSGFLPLYTAGNAVVKGNTLHFFITAAIFIVPSVIAYIILSATFIKTATSNRGMNKVKYKEKKVKELSPISSLMKKDTQRFLGSPIYLLNSGLGILFLLALTVLIIVKADTVSIYLTQIPFLSEYRALILVFGVCLMGSMIQISSPSVSLEGKNIWIVKSLPLNTEDILKSKILVHFIFAAVPSALLTICAAFVLKFDVFSLIIAMLAVVIYSLFCSVVGVFENLRHPNLNWVSETQVVKQGLSLLLSMLITASAVFLPGLLFYFILPIVKEEIILISGFTVIIALFTFMMRKWINKQGVEIFNSL